MAAPHFLLVNGPEKTMSILNIDKFIDVMQHLDNNLDTIYLM
jgi:hypothetical protein